MTTRRLIVPFMERDRWNKEKRIATYARRCKEYTDKLIELNKEEADERKKHEDHAKRQRRYYKRSKMK